MTAASAAEICFPLGPAPHFCGTDPILFVSVQHNGVNRFNQINHGGAIHQRYALPVHHGEEAAPIIAVQFDFNLVEILVIQINDQTDFLFLRRPFIGKLICS